MNGNSQSPGGSIRTIQILRATAALMVVFHHSISSLPAVKSMLPSDFGASGVDIFFVVSGFIIVVATHSKARGAGEFFIARLVRVAPIYWIITTIL
jgi:exopolysaccharide production protein ExoZ